MSNLDIFDGIIGVLEGSQASKDNFYEQLKIYSEIIEEAFEEKKYSNKKKSEFTFSSKTIYKEILRKVRLMKFDMSLKTDDLNSAYVSSIIALKKFIREILLSNYEIDLFTSKKDLKSFVDRELLEITDVRFKYMDLSNSKDIVDIHDAIREAKSLPKLDLEWHELLTPINLYYMTKIVYDFFNHIRYDFNNDLITRFNTSGVCFGNSNSNETYKEYFSRVLNDYVTKNKNCVKNLTKKTPFDILMEQKIPVEWRNIVKTARGVQREFSNKKLGLKKYSIIKV